MARTREELPAHVKYLIKLALLQEVRTGCGAEETGCGAEETGYGAEKMECGANKVYFEATVPSPFWGTPKLKKKGKKTLRTTAARFST